MPNQYMSDVKDDRWLHAAFPALVVALATSALLPWGAARMMRGADDSHGLFILILICTVPAQILMLLPIAFTASFIDQCRGLRRKLGMINWKATYWREVACVAAGLLPAMLVVAVIAEAVLCLLDIKSVPPIEVLLRRADYKGLLLILVTAAVVAPVVEELAFRRVIFGFFRAHVGTVPAIVITSTAFAAVHGSYSQVAPLFILAVVLQLMYVRHNSVLPCMLLHFLNNSIALSIFCLIRLFKVE